MPKSTIKKLQSALRILTAIKVWQLLLILVLAVVLSASLLRLNNLGMIERREAVKAADESGDSQELRNTLVELQRYVSSHMNTSLGPNGFYLVKTFERDRAAAMEAALDDSNPNSSVHERASIECRSRFQGGVDSFRNDYVQCVIDQVEQMSSGEEPDSMYLPKPELYKVNFAPPLWSPDPAGFSVLLSVLITVVIIIKVLTQIVIRQIIKHRFKTI